MRHLEGSRKIADAFLHEHMRRVEPPPTDTQVYPWVLHGYRLQVRDDYDPDMSVLSESDMEALEYGYGQARIMIFDERTATTHGRDWQAGRLGTMRYEDMIEDGPDKAEKVAFLREAAPYLRL